MARNLRKEILHVEFDVSKMTRKYGTLPSATADGWGSAEAGHLPIGIYSATNGKALLPAGAMVTEVYTICTETFADDASGSAASIKIGWDGSGTGSASGEDDDEFIADTAAGSAPFTAGSHMSTVVGTSSIVMGSNAADVDTAAEFAAVLAAKYTRQTAAGEIVFELTADEVTAGKIHLYIEAVSRYYTIHNISWRF